MSFNAKKFLDDYNIQSFPAGTKNVGRDYIGIRCPLCQDKSTHGGFRIDGFSYHCHRCGKHPLSKIISVLSNTSINEAKKIIKKYSTGYIHVPNNKPYKYAKEVIFPPETGPLTERAKQYLISRNFDPDYLIQEWNILSTGSLGEYKFSILAPIYLKRKLISYQCRDITGNWTIPYKGCPIEESVLHLKHTVYGFDKAIKNKKCIVVEGLMDNWRIGPGGVATFGIGFTMQQILLLVRNFDEIFILYDPEDEAQQKADEMYFLLRGYNKKTEVLEWPGSDPGDLTNEQAYYIMKEIGL